MTHFPSRFFHATIWLASTVCLAFTSQTLVAGPVHSKLNEGLLVWYPFNGDTDDESGNGLDATNFGAFLAPDRFGHCDQAYLFPGNAYMTISDPESLLSFDARSNSYTVTLWVKLESLAQRQEFIFPRNQAN